MLAVKVIGILGSLVAVAAADGLRGPSAMQFVDEGKTLVVGLERRGGLALIDTDAMQLRSIVELDSRFTDLASLGDGRLVGTDFAAGKVVLLRVENGVAKILDTESIAPYPVTVTTQPEYDRVFIASLWSKRITVVELIEGDALYVAKSIELAFEPREQLLVDANGERLLVADSFGGQLALIDTEKMRIVVERTIPAHNLRGLAFDAKSNQLFVTHQHLNPLARTTFDDVHWGMLLTNKIRSVPLVEFFDALGGRPSQTRLWNLGDVGQGGGDPDAVLVLADGRIATALAGVGQVIIGEFGDPQPKRFETGARPTSLLEDHENKRLYVANQLDDLITVIDLDYDRVEATIALSPEVERTARDRGERLFFSARVAHDGWFSCHSCHTDGHTNGLAADTMGDGGFGAPKLVPSLFGLPGTAPFGWVGNKQRLTDQVEFSLRTTMHHDVEIIPERDIDDLVAFLSSLPNPPRIALADTAAIARGQAIFQAQNCDRCHSGTQRTVEDVFDVGLVDKVGNIEFNPPSLRGVSLRRRFFHDGRADTLEAVIFEQKHQLESHLNPEQRADLLAFLRSL